MSVSLFIILIIGIIILFGVVIEGSAYIYYKNIYNRNASKKYFDINKKCNINFAEKYKDLAKKHNKYANAYIYTYICLLCILGIPAGIVIGKLYICLISFVTLLIVLLTPKKEEDEPFKENRKTNAEEEKEKLKKKYYNLIVNDIIIHTLKGRKQKVIDYSILDYDIEDVKELEDKENLIKNEEKRIDNFLSKIFKKTSRKIFKTFNVELCVSFKIDNQRIRLSRITNSKVTKKRRRGLDFFREKRIYSFIGYLVEIPKFSNLERLNAIDKKDYVLDEKNNTLYLLISDQINSSCYSFQEDRFMPKLYLKFEKERFLEKNYIYFDELYKFICSLVQNY